MIYGTVSVVRKIAIGAPSAHYAGERNHKKHISPHVRRGDLLVALEHRLQECGLVSTRIAARQIRICMILTVVLVGGVNPDFESNFLSFVLISVVERSRFGSFLCL